MIKFIEKIFSFSIANCKKNNREFANGKHITIPIFNRNSHNYKLNTPNVYTYYSDSVNFNAVRLDNQHGNSLQIIDCLIIDTSKINLNDLLDLRLELDGVIEYYLKNNTAQLPIKNKEQLNDHVNELEEFKKLLKEKDKNEYTAI